MENKAIFLPSFSQSWKYCFLFVRLAKTHPSGFGRYYIPIYYTYLHLCFLSLGPFEIPTKIGRNLERTPPFKKPRLSRSHLCYARKMVMFRFRDFSFRIFGCCLLDLFAKHGLLTAAKDSVDFSRSSPGGFFVRTFPMFTVHCIGPRGPFLA